MGPAIGHPHGPASLTLLAAMGVPRPTSPVGRRQISSWPYLLVFLLTYFLISGRIHIAQAAPLVWHEVAPGLSYTRVTMGSDDAPSLLHAFRIDPTQYRIDGLLASDDGRKTATVREMAVRAKALLVINGGFFSPAFEPLGLRIQSGRQRTPLKAISWWGIFYVSANTPKIAARGDFMLSEGMQMAVQSGPRLVVNGTIPALKPGAAERSAIGVMRDGRLVLVVTERNPMETTVLAEFFRKPLLNGGFDCPNALNLDGGGSSQIYVKVGRFTLDVPGFTPVTDAVAVFPR